MACMSLGVRMCKYLHIHILQPKLCMAHMSNCNNYVCRITENLWLKGLPAKLSGKINRAVGKL